MHHMKLKSAVKEYAEEFAQNGKDPLIEKLKAEQIPDDDIKEIIAALVENKEMAIKPKEKSSDKPSLNPEWEEWRVEHNKESKKIEKLKLIRARVTLSKEMVETLNDAAEAQAKNPNGSSYFVMYFPKKK